MKNTKTVCAATFAALSLAAALLVPQLTGCQTPGGGTNSTTITPARVQAIAQLASYVSGEVLVMTHPGSVPPQFYQVRNGLCAMAQAHDWNITTAAQIAATNGLSVLYSSEGSLIVNAAGLGVQLYDAFSGQTIDLNVGGYPQAFVQGSCDGLSQVIVPTGAPGAAPTAAMGVTVERLKARAVATRPEKKGK